MARQSEVVSDPESVVEVLGDSYSLSILSALARSAMNVREMSESLDVPIATAYRRVEDLERVGLIEEDGERPNDDGRNVSVYRSRVDEIQVSFADGVPHVEMETRSEATRSIDRAWQRIRDGRGGRR
ncbi:MAG: helix-turn-helix domain-containing protein [Halobacteriota archaeon]